MARTKTFDKATLNQIIKDATEQSQKYSAVAIGLNGVERNRIIQKVRVREQIILTATEKLKKL